MPEHVVIHAPGGISSIAGGPLAQRPPAGQYGRLYFANEGGTYKDNGASWERIGQKIAVEGDDLVVSDG